MREDEVAAAAMGVNLVRDEALGLRDRRGSFGGFAGAFLGSSSNTVNVDQFEFGFSVFILAMIIIGGMGNIWGVIARRGRPVDDQPLPAARAQRACPTSSASTST